jgi:O-antigen/teichoic acid export membrane protein
MKPVSRIFVTKLLDFVLRFGAAVLVARYLGPKDKGVLTFASLVVAWVATFGNFSLADATVYMAGRREFSPAQAATGTFLFSVLAGTSYGLAVFLLVHFGIVHWPVGDLRVFNILLLLIPLQLLVNNFTAIVQGLSLFKAYSVFMLLSSGLFFVAVLVATRAASNRLVGVVVAMIITAAFNAAALLVYLAKTITGRPQFSLRFLKEGLHYGLRAHVSVILETINRRLDQLVLGALVDPTELGWYSIAVSISELPQLLPDSIGTVLFPRVAGDQANAAAITTRSCRVTVLVMLATTVAIVACGRPMIGIIYGAAFLPAFKSLFWLCPGIVFLSLSKILTKYLCGMGKPQTVVWTTLGSALVTLVLIFPLVKHYGMVGAAIVSSISYTVGALFNLVFSARLSGCRFSSFLVPRKSDIQLNHIVQ